jgi:hypothetical protein
MNGTALMLATLHDGETRLADDLQAAARRHHDETEIRHVATDLAGWSRQHADQLADAAQRHGVGTGDPAADPDPVLADGPTPVRVPGGQDIDVPSPIRLLRDLVDLHTAAETNTLSWDMLTALAKATKQDDLLELADACRPRSERQAEWARSMIKVLSPQALTSL